MRRIAPKIRDVGPEAHGWTKASREALRLKA